VGDQKGLLRQVFRLDRTAAQPAGIPVNSRMVRADQRDEINRRRSRRQFACFCHVRRLLAARIRRGSGPFGH
jgi:hypothetical protein